MRVISGTAKGRHLQSVPGDSTRPITDRVKEALFNILGADVIDAEFLDLFGGTGGVGIEALSRGAAHAVFIDKNHKAQATIKANLELTRLVERGAIVRGDAFRYLQGVPQPFHYIYVAPPQYERLVGKRVDVARRAAGLAGGRRRNHRADSSQEYEVVPLENFEEIEQRKYSSTLLVFYEHKQEA